MENKTLTITRILIWFDSEPQLVRGLTENCIDVLAVAIPTDDDSLKYLAVEVSPDIIDGVIQNKIDLRDVFTIHNSKSYISTMGETCR